MTLLTNLYRFQVYNSAAHHLHTVCSPSQAKSPSIPTHPPLVLGGLSLHPFSLVITILSVSMSFLGEFFGGTVGFFCLFPPLFPPSPTNPLHSGSCQSVRCIYESVSTLLVSLAHSIPHISEIIRYLPFFYLLTKQ